MKKRYYQTILACSVAILIPYLLNAQAVKDIKINARIEQQSLQNILTRIEQSHPVRFYFKTEELPKMPYTIAFQDAGLEEVMQKLLETTTLGFFIYRDYAVIIAPRDVVSEVYSANYYLALEQSLNKEEEEKPQQRILTVGDISKLKPSGRAKVTGTVRSKETREEVIGATVLVTNLNQGTATDADGKFQLDLPTGTHELLLQFVGNADLRQQIQVFSDGDIILQMESAAVNLDEVIVGAQAPDANVENVQIGVTRLDLKSINKLPSFLGEVDVIKSLLLSPGVSTIGEGAVGFNVRGGEVDQNLVLQDEGFIFNASHALGFFSTFHSDLISNVTLYKGIIPAQYGGRLASVLDVEMRDGNFDRFKVKASVGPVSGRISLEGPVIPKKSSFIAGFRSSYSDWILRAVNNLEVRNSSVFFYDANLRYTHRLNDKNTIILSGYASQDEFTYNQEFGFDYRTLSGQAIHKRIFSDQLFSQLSANFSRYESTQYDFTDIDAARLDNNIAYFKAQEHLTYTPSEDLQLDAGLSAIYYITEPGERNPHGDLSRIFAKTLEKERGLESAAFLNAEWSASAAFQISGGLRLGLYQFLGEKTVFEYANPDFPNIEEIIDTNFYNKGKVIASYASVEPRLSARYRLSPNISIKAGYSRTAQFINQIFNSDSPTPTSQFQLSTNYIEPTRSHNVSLGYFQNFKENLWETSLEIYGRSIDQLFDYKDFAELAVNEHIETELLSGVGRAYGMELSIKKNKGLFNGFLSYTMSRTERKIEGINSGNWYPSNFDKPHDVSLVLNYQYNQRHTFTMNFTYGTGRPTTPPLGGYRTPNGLPVPIYTERNALRIPDYHRLDLAYTIGKGYKKDKKFKTSWTVSLYNVYGRKNAFSVFFTQTPFTSAQANQLSILGSIFPAITFNLETQ
ncbi:MAG: carboxypeptidase-like regulatory domain-containing protein [Saprospiraceae bacterium]|nr:carboxypeptidase-like regulatory domain-containing protein [Saprospiraceae bacterium]